MTLPYPVTTQRLPSREFQPNRARPEVARAEPPVLQVYYDPVQAMYLHRLVKRMAYGDALVRFGWRTEYRLEYICPDKGFVHYILYCDNEPVGLQYVRATSWLDEVQRKLGAYLVTIGFRFDKCELKMGGAKTPLSFKHNRLPHLFVFDRRRKFKVRIIATDSREVRLRRVLLPCGGKWSERV